MKRVLSILFMCSSIFFTGCNGPSDNIADKLVNEMETSSGAAEILQAGQTQITVHEKERYELEGTAAFFILPDHDNNPDNVIDFKVLDYTSDDRFVYAYITPYRGSEGTGLTVPESGSAEAYSERPEYDTGMEYSQIVTVLMSYAPESGAYQVFHCAVSESRFYSRKGEMVLETHRLGEQEAYFLFINQRAYVYDKDGAETYYYDASSLIQQEVAQIAESSGGGNGMDVVINGVVMDQQHYLYIPISCQTRMELKKEDLENLEDRDLEGTMIQRLLICFYTDIGGADSQVVLVSENDNWERQREKWMEYDGNDEAPFESIEELEQYCERMSLDNIKSGVVGPYEDDFSVFFTKDGPLNLELAGYPDLDNLEFWLRDSGTGTGITASAAQLLGLAYQYISRAPADTPLTAILDSRFYEGLGRGGVSPGTDTRMAEQYYTFVQTLLILAAEKPGFTAELQLLSHEGSQLLIPGLAPGAYDAAGEPVQNKWVTGANEMLFLYKTDLVDDQKFSKYAELVIDKRFEQEPEAIHPVIKADGDPDLLTRTLYYQTVDESIPEDSTEDDTVSIEAYEEEAVAVNRYRLIMPENTRVYWMEADKHKGMLVPGADNGLLLYEDKEIMNGNKPDGQCSVKYTDGSGQSFYDEGIPGFANAAAILQGKGHQVILLSTSKGLKVYPYRDQQYQTDGSKWIVNEQLSGTDTNAYTVTGDMEFLVSTTEHGLMYYDFNKQLNSQIIEGSYYQSFAKRSADDDYVVVGFQSSEFRYRLKDIVMAKVYTVRLNQEKTSFYTDSVITYLNDKLRSAKAAQYKIEKSEAEQQDQVFVERIFYGDESTAMATLEALMQKLGLGAAPEELKEYVLERGERLRAQAQGMEEFYALAGIRRPQGSEDEAFYQEIEASLEAAIYISDLEQALVKAIMLPSGFGQVENLERRLLYQQYYEQYYKQYYERDYAQYYKQEYERDYTQYYKQEYEEYQEKNYEQYYDQDYGLDSRTGSETNSETNSGTDSETNSETDAKKDYRRNQNEEIGSAYTSVLELLQEDYQQRQTGTQVVLWEDYLKVLLKKITEGNAVDAEQKTYEIFCEIVGSSTEAISLTDLKLALKDCRTVISVQEVMLAYALDTPTYRNYGYETEFERYQGEIYSNDEERREAFENAGFYAVILEMKAAQEEPFAEQGTDWDRMLRQIIKELGSGIVIDDFKDRWQVIS